MWNLIAYVLVIVNEVRLEGKSNDMSRQVTMFSTVWCGHCRRLKRQLDEEGIDYREVDLDQDPSHNQKILERTGGYRIVPTVEIHGDLLVNPSVGEIRAALR